jgi:hypothetical protein
MFETAVPTWGKRRGLYCAHVCCLLISQLLIISVEFRTDEVPGHTDRKQVVCERKLNSRTKKYFLVWFPILKK